MKKNIGTKDRIIRAVLGLLLLIYSLWQESYIAFALSLFTFYEAAASWCIYYQLIGKNSCPIKGESKGPKDPEDS